MQVPFIFRKAHPEHLKPVNWYLLDQDAASMLKHVYSGSSKSDLEDDDDIMIDFFGSVEVGRSVMEGITADTWVNL